jgi:hypothetical protein
LLKIQYAGRTSGFVLDSEADDLSKDSLRLTERRSFFIVVLSSASALPGGVDPSRESLFHPSRKEEDVPAHHPFCGRLQEALVCEDIRNPFGDGSPGAPLLLVPGLEADADPAAVFDIFVGRGLLAPRMKSGSASTMFVLNHP